MAELWSAHRGAVERLVYCKIPRQADAEDVLQEVWLCAWENRAQLADAGKQKAWLLGIARHKIADYYRRLAKAPAPLPEDWDVPVYTEHHVSDTLDALPPGHSALLRRAYLEGYALRDVAREAGVPLGTVKSRLHTAREAFRQEYEKGETAMKKTFPKTMPGYTITPSELPPFAVRCEELGMWFFRPREGEACHWALYDMPGINRHAASRLANLTHILYAGKAIIHGVEGLAFDVEDIYPEDGTARWWFAAQRTDTHVRWIAVSSDEGGVKELSTFLDDDFLRHWGSGEENIGYPIHRPIEELDGRFRVTIRGKIHETMRLRAYGKQDSRGFHDRYLNAEGRTVLWREFALPASLPERGYAVGEQAETVEYEGKAYVHWFDCIQDFVL